MLRTQPVSETRIRTAGLSLLEISTPENLNYEIIMIVRCVECLPANKEADEVNCVKQSRLKMSFRKMFFSLNFIIFFLPSLVEEHAAHRDRM